MEKGYTEAGRQASKRQVLKQESQSQGYGPLLKTEKKSIGNVHQASRTEVKLRIMWQESLETVKELSKKPETDK